MPDSLKTTLLKIVGLIGFLGGICGLVVNGPKVWKIIADLWTDKYTLLIANWLLILTGATLLILLACFSFDRFVFWRKSRKQTEIRWGVLWNWKQRPGGQWDVFPHCPIHGTYMNQPGPLNLECLECEDPITLMDGKKILPISDALERMRRYFSRIR